MNEKQKRFCNEYVKTMNAAKTAHTVGYSLSSAYKLMANPEIKEYIAQQSEKINEDIQNDSAKIYNTVKSIMEDETAKNRDRLKAAEVLARLKANGYEKNYKGAVIIMGENLIPD